MATVKTWKVTNPNNEEFITRDLNALCEGHFDNARRATCGLRSKGVYKGWRCEETDAFLNEEKMAQFNPHFSYIRSEGSSFVRVVCKECGTEYVYTPSKLESKRIGCGVCYERKVGFSLKGKKFDTTNRNVYKQEDGFKAIRDNLGDVEIELLEEWHGKGTKIRVLCPTHGWYNSTVDGASKHKCKKCANETTAEKNRAIPPKYITPEEVLGRLTERRGYTPNVRFPKEWKGTRSTIEIECPIHGWYPQTVYSSYTSDIGCEKCRYESMALKSRISQEDAFKDIEENLGYMPNIKLLGDWVGNQTPIEVCCRAHGWYTTTVENARQYKCKKCGNDIIRESETTTFEQAVEKISEFYGYTPKIRQLGEWMGVSSRVEIYCDKHGWVDQVVGNAYKYGCRFCAYEDKMKNHRKHYLYNNEMFDSKWEIYVSAYFDDHNVAYEREYPISYTIGDDPKLHTFYCDFYLTDEDRLVEVKGAQFFTEDGTIDSPWTKGLTEEKISKLSEMYNAKHTTAKENGVTYITSIKDVNTLWFQYNEGVQLEDISKYQSWFYKHHTDLDISVWEKDN